MHAKRFTNTGFSMIELIVTMIIVGGIASMGVFTMRGYLPKQRLISSADTVEKALSQAQYEATSRVLWTCIKHDLTKNQLNIYIDQNGDHGAANACGNATDYIIGTYTLGSDVGFADCTSGDGNPFDTGGVVWFNTSGSPAVCDSGNCSVENLEFIITSSTLKPSNKSREVEASSSGLIEVIPRGEIGYNTNTYARTGTGVTAGAGWCE